MRSSRIAALASAAIVALTVFTVILPELNRSIVLGEAGVVEKVLEHFVQPELFATSLIDLSGEWLYTVKSYDEGVLEELYRPDAPVADWRTVTVPFTHAATVANSTVWLRRGFSLPEGLRGNRVRLIFLGAFYRAAVWLNGIYLGEHEGYFSPFYFDVTDLLNFGGANTLVVCLSSPVELDLDNKRAFTGIFGDGNVKPYPRWALGKLPRNYEWFVPIGLWRPVVLAVSGPVAVNVVLIDAVPEDSSARVRVRLYVSNVGERAQ
ncbi:sugar-binding domain-containing protein, partial [Thermofilum sp.]|uniref:sugar-binding domain-containing protein n=1 Tax=Thermofilum sp. TaxID=1961369 RepID=UPI00315F7AE4